MPEPVVPPPAVKPGYKTTEFWTSIGGMVAPLLLPHVPATVRAALATAAAAIYAISRGLAKLGIGRR